jgi:hypothetical protein
MITRPGRQAPIGEIPLKSGTGLNLHDKNLSQIDRKAIKSYPDP